MVTPVTMLSHGTGAEIMTQILFCCFNYLCQDETCLYLVLLVIANV